MVDEARDIALSRCVHAPTGKGFNLETKEANDLAVELMLHSLQRAKTKKAPPSMQANAHVPMASKRRQQKSGDGKGHSRHGAVAANLEVKEIIETSRHVHLSRT